MKYSTLTVGNSLQELQKKLSVHVEHVETLIKEAEGASESVSCMFRLYIPTLINCQANAKGTYHFQ